MTYLPGTWADVTRTGIVVRVDGDKLHIGSQPIDMPEPLLWVRADEGPSGVVVCGQGHQTGNAWLYVQARGWKSLGPTHGVSPMETDGRYVWCVHTAATWKCYAVIDGSVSAIGTVPEGSSQGWLDITEGDLRWADFARRVGAVMLPQRAGGYLIGQHPSRPAIVAQAGTETPRLVASGVTAFEPRACEVLPGLIRVVSRTPAGVFVHDSNPDDWAPLTPDEPQPEPDPEPQPEPEPEPDMSMLATLQRLRANYGPTMNDDECVEMLDHACWEEKAHGYGLSRKEAGTRGTRRDGQECCHDVIMLRDGTYWDCLASAGAGSTPVWGAPSGTITDPNRGWIAPIGPGVGTQPPPKPDPQPQPTYPTLEQIAVAIRAAMVEHEQVMSGPIAEIAAKVALLADRVEDLAQAGQPEQQHCTVPPQPWPVEINGGRLLGTLKGKVGA